MDLVLKKIGLRPNTLLQEYPDLTPSAQLVLSNMAALFKSSFAKMHGFVDLTAAQISSNLDSFFSERQIRRQLLSLKQAGAILEKKVRSKIQLFQNFSAVKSFTVMCAVEQGDDRLMTPSMSVMLSMILQKAAFNYRGSGEWFVSAAQLKNLQQETGLSERTITDNLKILVELKLIDLRSFVREKRFNSCPQICGFVLSSILTAAYSLIVKIARSNTVQKLLNKKNQLKQLCSKACQTFTGFRGAAAHSNLKAAVPKIEAERPRLKAETRGFSHAFALSEKTGQPFGKNRLQPCGDFGKNRSAHI